MSYNSRECSAEVEGLVERLRPDESDKRVRDDLMAQFDGYILHKRSCDMMSAFIQGKHCTCGLDAILARIDQRKEVGK